MPIEDGLVPVRAQIVKNGTIVVFVDDTKPRIYIGIESIELSVIERAGLGQSRGTKTPCRRRPCESQPSVEVANRQFQGAVLQNRPAGDVRPVSYNRVIG